MTPIHSFIVKVGSRCNLNCSYCYVYNRADSNWKTQPKLMSQETMHRLAIRIREHCQEHGRTSTSISLHGGEPLMGGLNHLRSFVQTFEDTFRQTGIRVGFGMQTNGLLLSEEILDFCLAHGVRFGISLDGPPRINDIHRRDLLGRGTSARLEDRLRVATSERYSKIAAGFLIVSNVTQDPVSILDYAASWHPPGVDFLLPHDNHDRLPPGKAAFQSTEYGEWLVRLYDHWMSRHSGIRIRLFTSLLRLLFNGRSQVETVGLTPADFIVVETNGDVEALDALKSTFHGATKLGFNVFEHSFDEVASHVGYVSRTLGAASLCATCQSCSMVSVCGGGYIPTRYAQSNGFDNPSVYCHDLQRIIRHMSSTVKRQLTVAGVTA
ncbi:MAG TPA: FxsB family cyclophane-forming radical SAM/SPASM peptide maturase [Polyangiaceae bacterium]